MVVVILLLFQFILVNFIFFKSIFSILLFFKFILLNLIFFLIILVILLSSFILENEKLIIIYFQIEKFHFDLFIHEKLVSFRLKKIFIKNFFHFFHLFFIFLLILLQKHVMKHLKYFKIIIFILIILIIFFSFLIFQRNLPKMYINRLHFFSLFFLFK